MRIEPVGINYLVIIYAAEGKYRSDERKCAGQMAMGYSKLSQLKECFA